MSGLLSGVLMVVGAAAAIATGGAAGVLIGALMVGEYAASKGWLGKGAQGFMSSGWGTALMAATALAGAGYAAYGGGAGTVTDAGSNLSASQVSDINAAGAQATSNIGAQANAAVAGGMQDIASQTGSSFIDSVGANSEVASTAEANSTIAAANNVAPASISAANPSTSAAVAAGQPAPGQTPNPTSVPGAQGSQASAQLTNADTAATKSGAGLVGGNQTTPTANAAPGTTPPPGSAVPAESTGPTPGGAGGSSGGFLNSAMQAGKDTASWIGKNPGVATMAGQALSGLAQGAAQEKMNQEQIAAAQWGNLQWQNPAGVAALQNASAQPITVPQGYLQRAQQTRALMGGGQGVQPLPAASPGAPLAPNPVAV